MAAMAAAVFGQQALVDGPRMGLVTDPVLRTVREAAGIPAAALLSGPLESARGLAWVEAAPGQSYALGADEENGALVMVTAGLREELALEPGARGVRFSADGAAAVVLYEDHGAVMRGLPESREEAWRVALPAGAEVAVTGDGREVAVFVEGRISRLGEDGSASEVAVEGAVGASYAEGSHTLLVTAAGAVMEFGADGARRWELPEGSGRALAAASPEGQVVAALEGGLVAVWDRASGEARVISCGCEAPKLARIGRRGLYRLNDAGEGPVWLLDVAGEEPRVLFIPAAARGEE